MSQINPLAGALAQTPQAQRQAAAERSTQVRRTYEKQKNTSTVDQSPDEFVESADAVNAVGDEDHHPDFKQKKQKRETRESDEPEEKPHIDLTA